MLREPPVPPWPPGCLCLGSRLPLPSLRLWVSQHWNLLPGMVGAVGVRGRRLCPFPNLFTLTAIRLGPVLLASLNQPQQQQKGK